jgi:hypothetical protein
MDLAPGSTWSFQTSSVADTGSGHAAYPNGSVAAVP